MEQRKFHLNIAICDDEAPMLTKLQALCRSILSDTYDLHLITAQAPYSLLHTDQIFDLALLDVQLLEGDGIQLARQLLSHNPSCRILFVSGFVQVVSDVYDVPHFAFILKDQLEEKLPRFLLQAAQLSAQEAGEVLQILSGKKIETIPLREIVYLERRGHYTYIFLKSGSILETKEKLVSLCSRLGSANFARCHISYIINFQHVRRIDGRTLILENGMQLPISLPHEEEVKNGFFRHMDK